MRNRAERIFRQNLKGPEGDFRFCPTRLIY